MKTSHKLQTPIDTIEGIFCNLCGMSCAAPHGGYLGLIEAKVIGGYSSNHLIKDGDVHHISLCEICLSELIQRFIYNSYQGNLQFPDEPHEPDFDVRNYAQEGFISAPEVAEYLSTLSLDISEEELEQDFLNIKIPKKEDLN